MRIVSTHLPPFLVTIGVAVNPDYHLLLGNQDSSADFEGGKVPAVHEAIRQCKHCGKFFIAEDLRAEYCSPGCRGAYNSKMTRMRVKKRQMREEQ